MKFASWLRNTKSSGFFYSVPVSAKRKRRTAILTWLPSLAIKRLYSIRPIWNSPYQTISIVLRMSFRIKGWEKRSFQPKCQQGDAEIMLTDLERIDHMIEVIDHLLQMIDRIDDLDKMNCPFNWEGLIMRLEKREGESYGDSQISGFFTSCAAIKL